MNTIENITESTFLSDVPKIRRSYKRMYRGFPVLNDNTPTSRPSHRIITYRGVTGVYSYI